MRLWSIHPSYLDRIGLVALWREGLLAKKVLEGNTDGYRNHPQLIRFRNHPDPLAAINAYLSDVLIEADRRGYAFDKSKCRATACDNASVTSGQLKYEFEWLMSKLEKRDAKAYELLITKRDGHIKPHPLFHVVEGPVESWEVAAYRGKDVTGSTGFQPAK